MDEECQIEICRQLLEIYGSGSDVIQSDVKDFKVYRSQLYGRTNVYSFIYKNNRYYVTDDYSLMDVPEYIKNVFKDINPQLSGVLLKNPVPQSDGAIYASGLDGVEYYLWEAPIE